MIGLKYQLEERGLTPRQLQKELPAINKIAYQRMGEHFFEKNFPKRFTYAAHKFLDYQPRKPSYNALKMKRHGHVDPLVFSGTSKRLALGIRDIRAKSNNKRSEVKIVIHAQGLNRRSSFSKIHMNDEVRTVAQSEHAALLVVLERGVNEELKRRNIGAVKS